MQVPATIAGIPNKKHPVGLKQRSRQAPFYRTTKQPDPEKTGCFAIFAWSGYLNMRSEKNF